MGDFCFKILFHFFARSVIGFTRTLDPTRPVTFVTAASAKTDRAVSTSLPFSINHIHLNAGSLPIDLFSLYVLFSYFRPRDSLMGICLLFFH